MFLRAHQIFEVKAWQLKAGGRHIFVDSDGEERCPANLVKATLFKIAGVKSNRPSSANGLAFGDDILRIRWDSQREAKYKSWRKGWNYFLENFAQDIMEKEEVVKMAALGEEFDDSIQSGSRSFWERDTKDELNGSVDNVSSVRMPEYFAAEILNKLI